MKKNFQNFDYIVIAIFIIVISSMTIGFAQTQSLLSFNGTTEVKKVDAGIVEITAMSFQNGTNTTDGTAPTYNGLSGTMNAVTDRMGGSNTQRTFTANYQVTITNNSFDDFVFTDVTITSSSVTVNGSTTPNLVTVTYTGITSGDEIEQGQAKTFTLSFSFTKRDKYNKAGSYTADFTINGSSHTNGSLLLSTSNTTGNLISPNKKTQLNIDAINTYVSNKQVSLSLNDNDFYIADSNENEVRIITIPANTTTTFNYYIMKKPTSNITDPTRTVIVSAESSQLSLITVGTMIINTN